MYHGDDFPQQRRLLVLGSGAGSRSGVGFLIFFNGAWEFTSSVLTCRSLFSRYPLRPTWSLHGLLTRLAWARYSRGICHVWCGLFAVFSHALCGLVVLAVSVTPGVVSSRSPHRLAWARCSHHIHHAWRGLVAVFSHALRGLVVLLGGGGPSAGSWVERGRSVERDNRLRVLFPFYQSAHLRLGVVTVFNVTVAVFGFTVAVFDFAVAVFGFALISSCPAWYRCSIRLRCGGIRLRPNLLHVRHGIVAVFIAIAC